MDKTLEYQFKSIVGGSNFMTPEVIDYYKRGHYVIELSTGSGLFCGSWCYGVTVANTLFKEHCVDLCKSFSHPNKQIAEREALDYINSLS